MEVSIFISGFLMLFSMLMSVGPQNLFLIRQGLSGNHVLTVGLVSAICDIIIITLGVTGLYHFIEDNKNIEFLLYMIGIIFLTKCIYSLAIEIFLKDKLAIHFDKKDDKIIMIDDVTNSELQSSQNKKDAIKEAIAYSIFNPLTWIETVVIISATAVSYKGDNIYIFAAGACLASVIWFVSLPLTANKISKIFENNSIIKSFNMISMLIMMYISYNLSSKTLDFINTNIDFVDRQLYTITFVSSIVFALLWLLFTNAIKRKTIQNNYVKIATETNNTEVVNKLIKTIKKMPQVHINYQQYKNIKVNKIIDLMIHNNSNEDFIITTINQIKNTLHKDDINILLEHSIVKNYNQLKTFIDQNFNNEIVQNKYN